MRGGIRILAVVVAAAVIGAPAHAAPRQESLFQDDDLLLHAPPEQVDETMAELASLGVDRVRLSVIWRNYAPEVRPADGADPAAYDPELLNPLDVAVRAAADNGVQVLLNLRGGAPSWALGANPPAKIADRDAYKPDPAAFGQFAQMLGRRYDGTYVDESGERTALPRVTAWSTWNEPNWGGLLQPQSERDRRGRSFTVAPTIYRRLHRAATAGLQATGHGSDVILLGETAPAGRTRLGVASHLKPVRFLRDLFCLNRKLRPLRGRAARRVACDFSKGPLQATGYAHHPYPIKQPPEQHSSDKEFVRLADAGRLTRILDAARRHKRIPGRIPVWYTEFGYQTRPPDPYRGIGLRRHAAWLVRAERLTYADRRVLASNQFLLRDSGPNPGYAPSDRRYWSTYQSGLAFADGTPKPAYEAYRLPFMTLGRVRPGRPVRLWGMVRPGAEGQSQSVRIEHRRNAGAAWAAVKDVAVSDPKGYFTTRIARARRGQYRFQWLRPEGDPLPSPPAVPSR